MYSFTDFNTCKNLYNWPRNLSTDGCTIQKLPKPLSLACISIPLNMEGKNPTMGQCVFSSPLCAWTCGYKVAWH